MYLLTITFFLIVAVIIVLFYLSRRKKTLRRAELNSHISVYSTLLENHVLFYQKLNITERERFLKEIVDFLAGVTIEGVGVEVSDLDKVLVASSAIIPIFSFKNWRYQNITNIILYPDTFNEEYQYEGEKRSTLGMVGTGYMNGQMVLSKRALHLGFSPQAGVSNTGIHEFVHLIDKSDGSTDGVPETLLNNSYVIPWLKLMHQEMRKIKRGDSDVDPYALTNEAEFLAVIAEYFFEKPSKLKKNHPELFQMLLQIFNVKN